MENNASFLFHKNSINHFFFDKYNKKKLRKNTDKDNQITAKINNKICQTYNSFCENLIKLKENGKSDKNNKILSYGKNKSEIEQLTNNNVEQKTNYQMKKSNIIKHNKNNHKLTNNLSLDLFHDIINNKISAKKTNVFPSILKKNSSNFLSESNTNNRLYLPNSNAMNSSSNFSTKKSGANSCVSINGYFGTNNGSKNLYRNKNKNKIDNFFGKVLQRLQSAYEKYQSKNSINSDSSTSKNKKEHLSCNYKSSNSTQTFGLNSEGNFLDKTFRKEFSDLDCMNTIIRDYEQKIKVENKHKNNLKAFKKNNFLFKESQGYNSIEELNRHLFRDFSFGKASKRMKISNKTYEKIKENKNMKDYYYTKNLVVEDKERIKFFEGLINKNNFSPKKYSDIQVKRALDYFYKRKVKLDKEKEFLMKDGIRDIKNKIRDSKEKIKDVDYFKLDKIFEINYLHDEIYGTNIQLKKKKLYDEEYNLAYYTRNWKPSKSIKKNLNQKTVNKYREHAGIFFNSHK